MGLEPTCLDDATVSLIEDLKEDVYIVVPEGRDASDRTDYVYNLNKALYKLEQAPCQKTKTIDSLLVIGIRFQKYSGNPGVYV